MMARPISKVFVAKREFPKNGRQFVKKKQTTMLDGDLVPYCKTLI